LSTQQEALDEIEKKVNKILTRRQDREAMDPAELQKLKAQAAKKYAKKAPIAPTVAEIKEADQ
jgi:predicted  nucleic acid-binding Zn-ribbon protein